LAKSRIVLIALEGASPEILSPLLDRGELPHLQSIIERGCSGALRATPPLVRSMLSTTLATGTQAPRHGVCGDVAIRPDGAGVQPVGQRAWRVPAVWDVLANAGLSTAVVAWPATAPATSWASGLVIDDSFPDAAGRDFESWILPPECVSARDRRREMRELRVHPTDITGEQIAAFVPRLSEIDQDADPRLTRIAVALARSSTVHAAATHVAARGDWDFLAVAYPMLAELQRHFLACRPPRIEGVDERDVTLYGSVVDAAYRIQDAMIGALLGCIDDPTTVIVASAYGFACGADRPGARAVAGLPASIAWHRHHGFVAAAGEGIARDALLHGARVEDVAPSILKMYGVTCDLMDGHALEALPRSAVSTVESAAPAAQSGGVCDHSLSIESDLPLKQRELVQRTAAAWLANTAEAHLAQSEFQSAASAYERLVEARPDHWLARARLASCYFHMGDLDRCRTIAEELIAAQPNEPWGYLLGAAGLVLDVGSEKADEYAAKALERGRDLPNVLLRLGLLHLAKNEPAKAEASFRHVLDIMPHSVEGHDGLGSALLAQNRRDEAIAAFRMAISASFHYPLAHMHLGLALASAGRYEEALTSVETALGQDPLVSGGDALRGRLTAMLGRRTARFG
jgi:tetratricopeptide (TPR) repeat protein